MLAIEHFNNRDPSVVSELAELGNCSVYFPTPRIVDSRLDDVASTLALWGASSADEPPCGVAGPWNRDNSEVIESILSALGVPNIDYSVERVDKASLSTRIGVFAAGPTQFASIAHYLKQERQYLAHLFGAGNDNRIRLYWNARLRPLA